MKLKWVNKGKEFETPKITIGTLRKILVVRAKSEENKIPDDAVELDVLIEMIADMFHRIDDTITHEVVADNLELDEIGIIVDEFAKVMPDLFGKSAQEMKKDFRKVLGSPKPKKPSTA